jgi:hypothetical protein
MGAGSARLAQARRSSRGRVLALAELWEAHRTTRQPTSSPAAAQVHRSATHLHLSAMHMLLRAACDLAHGRLGRS